MFKVGDKVVFIMPRDVVPQGSKGIVTSYDSRYVPEYEVNFGGRIIGVTERDIKRADSFAEFIKGFEDRYTENELWLMKWIWDIRG